MSMNDEQQKRWLAQLIGDASPDECGRIEEEGRETPPEAAVLEKVVEEVSQWAKESVPYTPMNLEEFQQKVTASSQGSRVLSWRLARSWRLWAAAAVAMTLMVAASQTPFSVSFGKFNLQWGDGTWRDNGDTENGDLAGRVQRLEQAVEQTASQIQWLALQNATLESELRNAAIRLAYSQRAETQARYRDMQDFIYLTNLVSKVEPATNNP